MPLLAFVAALALLALLDALVNGSKRRGPRRRAGRW